jgi:hypothetical protein
LQFHAKITNLRSCRLDWDLYAVVFSFVATYRNESLDPVVIDDGAGYIVVGAAKATTLANGHADFGSAGTRSQPLRRGSGRFPLMAHSSDGT